MASLEQIASCARDATSRQSGQDTMVFQRVWDRSFPREICVSTGAELCPPALKSKGYSWRTFSKHQFVLVKIYHEFSLIYLIFSDLQLRL